MVKEDVQLFPPFRKIKTYWNIEKLIGNANAHVEIKEIRINMDE